MPGLLACSLCCGCVCVCVCGCVCVWLWLCACVYVFVFVVCAAEYFSCQRLVRRWRCWLWCFGAFHVGVLVFYAGVTVQT